MEQAAAYIYGMIPKSIFSYAEYARHKGLKERLVGMPSKRGRLTQRTSNLDTIW